MRFKDSRATLPRVLDALARQTRQPDLLVGVDNASRDGSRELLLEHGARIVDWQAPYHVSKVLNAGVAACPTDLVVILSSHSAYVDTDVIERYVRAFADPTVAAASHSHAQVARVYPDRVTFDVVRARGLTRGSFYSNSTGCIRRAFWSEVPFDERIEFGAEDYHWGLEQLRRGRACLLIPFAHDYLRPGTPPHLHLKTSRMVHAISHHFGIPLVQRTVLHDLAAWTRGAWWVAKTLGRDRLARDFCAAQREWLLGRWSWQQHDPFRP